MNLRTRIAKLERVFAERKFADREKKDDLVNCVCGKIVIAFPNQIDRLTAELKDTCPVHGFRVTHVVRVTYTGDEEEMRQQTELDRVIGEYEARTRDWLRRRPLSGNAA